MSGSKFAGLGLAVDKPARMQIIHPGTRQVLRVNGAPEGEDECYIDLLAGNSAAGRAHDRMVNDRLMRSRGARYTADQVDADLIEKYSKLVKGWRLATLEGEPIEVPCTAQNARELFSLPESDWLRVQVGEFINDLGNYLPEGSKPSSNSPSTSSGSPPSKPTAAPS